MSAAPPGFSHPTRPATYSRGVIILFPSPYVEDNRGCPGESRQIVLEALPFAAGAPMPARPLHLKTQAAGRKAPHGASRRKQRRNIRRQIGAAKSRYTHAPSLHDGVAAARHPLRILRSMAQAQRIRWRAAGHLNAPVELMTRYFGLHPRQAVKAHRRQTLASAHCSAASARHVPVVLPQQARHAARKLIVSQRQCLDIAERLIEQRVIGVVVMQREMPRTPTTACPP